MAPRILDADLADWHAAGEDSQFIDALEDGRVLYFPRLAFALHDSERRFLRTGWTDGRAKNISYDGMQDRLKGAQGEAPDLVALTSMIVRYRQLACGLINALFPQYTPAIRVAQTSFRPARVEGRTTSWRKDDSRLHVDAFPSRPNQGERILRVFSNVNPLGEPRVWRVGERFDELAARMAPTLPRPWPGSAALLHALGITKSRRSEYDHLMLALHDRMKADAHYQQHGEQTKCAFAAGSTWICYSDQTPHAAMAGQFMFEQTLHLPVSGLYRPASAPIAVLARVLQRTLT